MRYTVNLKPSAKKTEVIHTGPNEYKVLVKEPPREGRANEGLIQALAEFFGDAPSNYRIVGGFTSRKKIVERLP